MAKNPFGKGRKQDAPYAIYTSHMGWEWRVLKTYKLPSNEVADQYARWFVAARSPHTWGEFELGDTYRRDVIKHGRLVAADPEWLDAMQANGVVSWGRKVPTPAEWIAEQANA